ncbi:MAG: DUF11 domain-containing protein [Verrucomicrobia bacterium]|nr:DUF11 domain-containing protein [Verrucomicrobiota bacterium]
MNSTRILIGLAAAPLAAFLLSGCSAYNKRIHARTNPTQESVTQVREGYDTFGRKWDGTETAPAPKAVAQRAGDVASVELNSGLVRLTKRVPAAATVGETFSYDLTATAVEDAGYVVVTDTIPPGATYVKSEPPAAVDGNVLTWRFPAINKGDAKNIKVWLRADREGDLSGCATVTAVPRGCVGTLVGKPALAIQKTGPETAPVDGEVNYTIVVSNKGTSVARNVVVTDAVPQGMTHAGGQKTLTFNAGDLASNQSKTFQAAFRATQRGKICNVAVATSSNAGKVQDDACTVIVQPGVKVFKTGDKQQFLTRNARYHITVTNIGDTTLKNVAVTDTAPAATRIVAAAGASITGNTAVWTLPELRAGDARSFEVTVTSTQAGNHCNTVSVATAEGLKDSAEACTLWKGLSAILIEMVDDPDPIQIGESTTYTIRVTNQGTADDNQVTVVANFPAEVKPTAAQGGTVAGQTVKFPPVVRLAPKQVVTYTITAKGAQVGDARIRTELTSDQLTRPVIEEESTTVY